MTPLPILLFAAGKGTRMGHLTADKPKPLVRVAGQALIDHALGFVDQTASSPRVVNLHYKGAQLRHHLSGRDIVFSDETDMLLETGGGLRNAMPLLRRSPVVTLNTDAVWAGPNPLQHLIDAWDDKMEALLLTVPLDQVNGHAGNGDFIKDVNGRLRYGAGEVYTGVQIIRTDRLSDIKNDVFSLRDFWSQIALRGGLYGTSYSGHWCDVGQPSSIPIAEAMLQAHIDV